MTAEELYLDLLKKTLTRYLFGGQGYRAVAPTGLRAQLAAPLLKLISSQGLVLARPESFDAELRAAGGDWPTFAETMIGLRRLDSIQQCIRDVLQRGVPGDFLEAGVWRGGAAIFMRAILKVYGDTNRRVWAADSFQGLPKPDPRYPLDAGNTLWTLPHLAVSLEVVKANFERYGLLDDQVRFLVGWFHDTLPAAPIDRLSVLRVDGDLYSSTIDALAALYPKVSIGGYIVVDDYGIAALGCQRAVDDYRAREGITEPLQRVETAAFWQRH